jgi:2-dehydro-3-deoxygluconokinase
VNRFLALGECMVELSDAGDGLYRRGFAGDTFNAAWYARQLLPKHWNVGYGSVIGSDAASDEMAAFMQAQGIDTTALRRHPSRTVGLYMISLNAGERSFSYWRSQSAAKTLADDPAWLEAIVKDHHTLHFSAITLAILPPAGRETLCAVLTRARDAGATVAFDTNLRPRLWESTDAMRAGVTLGARAASIVLPSFDEDAPLFGDTSPEITRDRYANLGAQIVAVKQGAGAVLLWDGKSSDKHTPPNVLNPVDTTAAGDSFAGAFLAGLALNQTATEAARRAIHLASNVIQFRGALVPAALSGVSR